MSIAIQFNSKLIKLSQSAAMLGGYFLLLCEIRFEHRAVLIDDWHPWIPIVFCGLTLLVIPPATLLWDRGGKIVLMGCYCLTVCLGFLGFVFHSEGQMIQRLTELFIVWSSTPQTGAAVKALHPPVLAPLAFMGLGSIGLLFSADVNRTLIADSGGLNS